MSMFYRKFEDYGDFYHADTIRHRSEIKRGILELCDRMDRETATFENALGYFSGTSPRLILSIRRMLDTTMILSENLNILDQNHYTALYETHRGIEESFRRHVNSMKKDNDQAIAVPLAAAAAGAPLAGGKASILGELAAAFPELVPGGFVLTTRAYNLFIEENRLDDKIHALIHNIDAVADRDLFRGRTREIRRLLETVPIPETILSEIRVMLKNHSGVTHWAARSSCAGESGRAAFPGQFDSILNVPGDSLADAWRKVVASRFSDRAVSYRLCRGLSETATPMAVLFMPMIAARSSGVLFTRDPGNGAADRVIINSVWGLAADLMLGRAEPDTFTADRSTGKIINQHTVEKKYALFCDESGSVEKQPVAPEKIGVPSLSADETAALVKAGLKIERHFGAPQDIEWAVDSDGAIRVLQSRDLMVGKRGEQTGGNPETGELLIEGGTVIFPGWAIGRMFSPANPAEYADAPTGSILIVKQPAADIIGLLPYLNGIIIEQGEPEGQLAARIRESAIPCLAGLDNAVEILSRRRRVMMDAARRKVFTAPDSPEKRLVKNEIFHKGSAPGNIFSELLLGAGRDAKSPPSSPDQCRTIRDIVDFIRSTTSKFNPVSGKIQN